MGSFLPGSSMDLFPQRWVANAPRASVVCPCPFPLPFLQLKGVGMCCWTTVRDGAEPSLLVFHPTFSSQYWISDVSPQVPGLGGKLPHVPGSSEVRAAAWQCSTPLRNTLMSLLPWTSFSFLCLSLFIFCYFGCDVSYYGFIFLILLGTLCDSWFWGFVSFIPAAKFLSITSPETASFPYSLSYASGSMYTWETPDTS